MVNGLGKQSILCPLLANNCVTGEQQPAVKCSPSWLNNVVFKSFALCAYTFGIQNTKSQSILLNPITQRDVLRTGNTKMKCDPTAIA